MLPTNTCCANRSRQRGVALTVLMRLKRHWSFLRDDYSLFSIYACNLFYTIGKYYNPVQTTQINGTVEC